MGVAVQRIRAGSLPTSGSVSRKALTSRVATRGRNRAFCCSVPNIRSGSATPIDWCADSSVYSAEFHEPTSSSARL